MLHVHQFRKGKARSVQRLQKIVTDSGEEARLEEIGALGHVSGIAEFDIGMCELRQRVIEFLGPEPDLDRKSVV
jgi:hypothetical protein